VAKPEPCDVLVIGAGAAGAMVTRVLAEAGIDVVCLEQGGWTAPADRPHAGADWEWRRLADFSTEPNTRRGPHDYPVDTTDEHTLMWNAVGGSTAIYTALWPRLRPSDFRKGDEHGLAPNWPLSYEELAPFYDRADLMVGTSGLVGDPAMPPRGPFATPPLPLGHAGRYMARAFDRLGWHWWPMPAAVLSEAYDGRPGCNHCGGCVSGCPRGALADAAVALWPHALARGAKLITGARVERIETDIAGRATGAAYIDRASGERRFQPARLVVLAANGVGTPRLLLLSECARFPSGLANGSDQVGRNLMHHTLVSAEIWVEPQLDGFQGFVGALISSQFAETDEARGFVNGFNFNVARGSGPGMSAVGVFSRQPAPWGAAHHAWFRRHFAHSFRVHAIGDDLPQAENRVTLSASLKDTDGLPAPKIAYRPHANDWRQMAFMRAPLQQIAQAADAFHIAINDYVEPDGVYRTPAWHLLGTARMGDDAASSVVDRWHRAWEVPNLYIVDGSSMPTGGVVNPTATITALALRAAEHIRDVAAKS
jgi:2-methyl-1,2-propanediol dehydrogenase